MAPAAESYSAWAYLAVFALAALGYGARSHPAMMMDQ